MDYTTFRCDISDIVIYVTSGVMTGSDISDIASSDRSVGGISDIASSTSSTS